MKPYTIAALWIMLSLPTVAVPFFGPPALAGQSKPSVTGISESTPAPQRFVVRGSQIFDVQKKEPVFFKGMGYSPYLSHETPLKGDPPGNDGRYREHLGLMKDMG